jgi:hypothetical protein
MAATSDRSRRKPEPAVDDLLALQSRYVEAWRDAGQIMLDAMRAVMQRQSELAEESVREFWSDGQVDSRGGRGELRPMEPLERLHGHYRRTLGGLQEVTDIMLKAQSEAMQVLAEGMLGGAEQTSRKAA